ncbi:hypothetical protein [Acetobacterium sp.]|uniref:hypothetical protein n=1 Tax=Acetobacterium sp. TaxID=1872094 RepID=UPI002F40A0BB
MASTINRKRKRRQGPNKKRLTLASYVVIACLITFVVMAMLLFQKSAINEVNSQILSLQKTLDVAVQINDSKEGQLVINYNLQAIEAQARGYGMTEPLPGQYRRETTTEKKPVLPIPESPAVKGWLENLF